MNCGRRTAKPPTKGGGATARVGDATHDVRWTTGPARHEAGTPNLLGAVALAKVCASLESADRHRVPAGDALAVNRDIFSGWLTETLSRHPGVQVVPGEVSEVPEGLVVFATGPLTSDALTRALEPYVGSLAAGQRDGVDVADQEPLTGEIADERARSPGR